MTIAPNGYGTQPGGYGRPTGRGGKRYLPGFNPGTRGDDPQIFSGRGRAASAPGMGGGGFGSPGMGGGGMSMPGMGGGAGMGGGGQAQSSGFRRGSEGHYSGPGGGPEGLPGGLGGDIGGGFGGSDRASGQGGAMGQNAGGFGQGGGNQGSTGFGGGGWSDMTPKLGGGMGGGTTPNRPPPVNQPPTMNTPTGGFNPTAPSPPPPRTPSPTPNPGQDTRYPPGAGVHNFAQTDAYRNSMGQGGPQSPMTPNLGNPYQPSSTGGGGGQTVPGWGNTIKRQGPTYNYGGNTSTFNMTQQGDQFNQGQSMKRLQNRRRAKAAQAPEQRKRIGSTVNQNLQVMRPGMRYM